MDVEESYQQISRMLYQVSEEIGVTVNTRKLLIERCISTENLPFFSFLDYYGTNVYVCGSTYEGTTSPDLKSDLDIVNVHTFLPKVADISDCPMGKSLALIQDYSAPAGYFKLQLVHNRLPLFEHESAFLGLSFFDFSQKQHLAAHTDKEGRLVCYFNPSVLITAMFDGMHGPAMLKHKSGNISAKDIVTALESDKWPDCASEWLVRQRHFQWPSNDMIQRCKELGCLFVPKGHPFSDEQYLQWRTSLSFQERFLVTQFNSVQLKCYVLLKILKKERVDCHMKDVLSSYHLKTCMFYMIENTPTDFWRPENLLNCCFGCLKTVLLCVEKGNLPNYFIPAENMLDRMPRGQVRLQLYRILQDLVCADCTMFNDIQCDLLGDRLRVLPTYYGVNMQYGACFTIQRYHVQICYIHLQDVLWPRLAFLHGHCCGNLETSVASLIKSVHKLKEPLTVTKHTVEEDKRALSYYIPYIELSLMSGLISVAVKQGRDQGKLLEYMTSTKWQEIADKSDIFSAKLKQASLMYKMGFHFQALDILSPLVGVRRTSICGCHRDRNLNQITESLIETTAAISEITTEKLLKTSVVPCVIYTVTEKEITPAAINYEFLPAADSGVTPDTIDPGELFSGPVIAVDGNFLLHFLLYLNHHQLNMDVHAAADIDNMESLTNWNVCHKETCHNLLGWVYKEQDQVDRAIANFEKSIHIKPYSNAASWHMKDIETITSYQSM